ncbi:hypothetical protein ANCCAN_20368 [Ancylostoma caninum]|uniref:SXP/RAL-2 family protein Ani s 5-like cation-binding domain-containing protein n=1 Tax=Ancylostoma caninum TaxID=29170 RepID=A0A368FRZ5_ANCCA|nr:hypothetical protein ANCCAN_20368 [Ancylostoma caninum]
MNSTITLLCLSCCAAFVNGRLKYNRGFPPISIGAAPPYLRDVTEEAKEDYFAILKNANRTIAEHKAEVFRWARKYLLEEKLAEFNKKEEESKEKLRTDMRHALEELHIVYEKFNEIVDNEEQTHQQRRSALLQLKKEYSEAFAVMKFAIDLLSTKGRKHRTVNPEGIMEFRRRHQGKLVQRRFRGGKRSKKIEQTVNSEEISNGTLIMRGTDQHHERFRKHIAML